MKSASIFLSVHSIDCMLFLLAVLGKPGWFVLFFTVVPILFLALTSECEKILNLLCFLVYLFILQVIRHSMYMLKVFCSDYLLRRLSSTLRKHVTMFARLQMSFSMLINEKGILELYTVRSKYNLLSWFSKRILDMAQDRK